MSSYLSLHDRRIKVDAAKPWPRDVPEEFTVVAPLGAGVLRNPVTPPAGNTGTFDLPSPLVERIKFKADLPRLVERFNRNPSRGDSPEGRPVFNVQSSSCCPGRPRNSYLQWLSRTSLSQRGRAARATIPRGDRRVTTAMRLRHEQAAPQAVRIGGGSRRTRRPCGIAEAGWLNRRPAAAFCSSQFDQTRHAIRTRSGGSGDMGRNHAMMLVENPVRISARLARNIRMVSRPPGLAVRRAAATRCQRRAFRR